MTALYLLVLTQDRSIQSLRDLTPAHLPLLRNIRQQSEKAAMEKYGISKGELRFFVHYQPTYCKFNSVTANESNDFRLTLLFSIQITSMYTS